MTKRSEKAAEHAQCLQDAENYLIAAVAVCDDIDDDAIVLGFRKHVLPLIKEHIRSYIDYGNVSHNVTDAYEDAALNVVFPNLRALYAAMHPEMDDDGD